MITPPRLPDDHPDRNLECQEALESRLVELIDTARRSGWAVGEITIALAELADNLRLQHEAVEDMEAAIDAIRERDR